jgi:hypothetical protein
MSEWATEVLTIKIFSFWHQKTVTDTDSQAADPGLSLSLKRLNKFLSEV